MGGVDILGISKRRFVAHDGEMANNEKTPMNWHFSLYSWGFKVVAGTGVEPVT